MVFSSIAFVLYFLPLFMIVYGMTPKAYRNVTLLIGSLVFYALGDVGSLFLLLLSVIINYTVGRFLIRSQWRGGRRWLLAAAVSWNLGLLILFKVMQGELGLPLGISFYTFQVLSYLADVYRGNVAAEASVLKLAAYITMFPNVVSGPLVNYREIEPALAERRFTAVQICDGLKVFTMGLAAKVLLADRIGLLWNYVEMTGFESISTPLAWLGAVAYSLKIYFDFYGYSLMAAGVAGMLGFTLPQNFREPYLACGVRDFYRRWHMTLGRWFREYVYIPLGGNRHGELRTILNLLAVWLLTGLWHGLSVNFLIWGLVLWACIVLERLAGKITEKAGKTWKLLLNGLARLWVWAVIPVTWVIFAIPDREQLLIYLGRMTGLMEGINVNVSDWQRVLSDYAGLLAVCIIACTPLVRKLFQKGKDRWIGLVLLTLLFWVSVLQMIAAGANTFLYFSF